jgi:N utilization substance protein B
MGRGARHGERPTVAVSVARGPSRKQARRDALFVLYQREVRGESPEQLFRESSEREGYPVDPYTVTLVDGVIDQTSRLDAGIGRYSRDWPVERLAPLERSLLRLALYVITAGVVPPEVAVDEAVRLARRYSTDEAGSLVNGILGAYLRDRPGPASPAAPGGEAAGAAQRHEVGDTAPGDDPGQT